MLVTLQVSFLLRRLRTLLANDTGRRIGRGTMAGASPATTMIRLRRPMHAYHGSGTPCGCHAELHHIFHSPAESCSGEEEKETGAQPQTVVKGCNPLLTCPPDRVPNSQQRITKSNPKEGCLSTLIESYPHIKALYVDNLLFCKDSKRLISGF